MKQSMKLWLLAISLILVFSLVFATVAFATDGTESETEGETETPTVVFDEVPEEAKDKAFVIFNADTGKYLGASGEFHCEDTTNAHDHDASDITATTKADGTTTYTVNSIMKVIFKQTGNYLVRMQADEYTWGCGAWSLSQNINSNVTIDLDGGTFIFKNALTIQGRNASYTPHLIFKNGTIVNQYKTGFIAPLTKNIPQVFAFTFENITFKINPYSGTNFAAQWIFKGTGNPDEAMLITNTVTVKDCVFDTTGLTTTIPIFALGYAKEGYITCKDTVTLIGSNILGSAKHVVLFTAVEGCTFNLEKGADGNYITNTRPKADDIPVLSAEIDGQKMILSKDLTPADAPESDTATYAFDVAPVIPETPYGAIPELYGYNPQNYPILLFDITTGKVDWAGSLWGGEGASGGVLQQIAYNLTMGPQAVYLQGDIETSTYWNHGNIYGNHIIDLNGHTIIAKSVVFQAVAKTKTYDYEANFTIKNGTINLGAQILIGIGSNIYTPGADGAWKMTANYTFENVTFDNITTGVLVDDGRSVGNFETITNITFRECTFNLAKDRTTSLCRLGCGVTSDQGKENTGKKDENGDPIYNYHYVSCAGYTVNVNFEGGSIIATTNNVIPKIYTNNYDDAAYAPAENKTIVFTKGENGYTTVVTKSSTAFSDYVAFPVAEGGERIFINEDTHQLTKLSTHYLDTYAECAYGKIPQRFLDDPETHKVVVFNKTLGYAIDSFSDIGGETNTSKGTLGGALEYCKNGTDMVIFLLTDVTASQYNNTGSLHLNVTIDLNDHNVTVAGTAFLFLQAKHPSALTITIKNGTISTNPGKHLAYIAAIPGGAGKVTTAIYEDVIINLNKGSHLVYDNGSYNPGTNEDGSLKVVSPTNTYVEFNNCEIHVHSESTTALVGLGTNNAEGQGSRLLNIDVKIRGGEITYGGTPNHVYKNVKLVENQTFAFGKNADGEYTRINLREGISLKEDAFVSENGEVIDIRKLGVTEGTVNYVLTPFTFVSAYLNLTNDLNFVYRTFLPTGYENPTVTFTVGTSTVVVDVYTEDENGLYCFRLPNINPARMGENITAVLTATYNGEAVTLTYDNLSVKSYAEKLKEDYKDNATLVDLIDKLLVYGASAQQYLGMDESTFVAAIGSLNAVPESENTLSMSGEKNENYDLDGFAMNIDGAFALRVRIKALDNAGLTLVATKGEQTRTYDLAEYAVANGYISVVYDGILADDLDTDVTFTLFKDGEAIGRTLTTNANAYLYRANATEDASLENLAVLARALYAYGIAAQNYTAE